MTSEYVHDVDDDGGGYLVIHLVSDTELPTYRGKSLIPIVVVVVVEQLSK